jgi:hypothetical protein
MMSRVKNKGKMILGKTMVLTNNSVYHNADKPQAKRKSARKAAKDTQRLHP